MRRTLAFGFIISNDSDTADGSNSASQIHRCPMHLVFGLRRFESHYNHDRPNQELHGRAPVEEVRGLTVPLLDIYCLCYTNTAI